MNFQCGRISLLYGSTALFTLANHVKLRMLPEVNRLEIERIVERFAFCRFCFRDVLVRLLPGRSRLRLEVLVEEFHCLVAILGRGDLRAELLIVVPGSFEDHQLGFYARFFEGFV